MDFEIIETAHLFLRKLTPADFDTIFENYSKEEIKNILGLRTEEEFLVEKEKQEKGYTTYRISIVYFQMIDKETNQIIGGCGFHNWFALHARSEMGYAFKLEEYKRKGLMTEAVQAIIDYGFNAMKLNRIEACISPNNEASLQLIRKFNFTQEGVLRKHFFHENEYGDSIIFGLLREEYVESRKA